MWVVLSPVDGARGRAEKRLSEEQTLSFSLESREMTSKPCAQEKLIRGLYEFSSLRLSRHDKVSSSCYPCLQMDGLRSREVV